MRDFRGSLAVLATGILLLAFATPARSLWAQTELWYAPFVVWGVAILALAFAGGGDGDSGRNAP
jgi:hypothetical protein